MRASIIVCLVCFALAPAAADEPFGHDESPYALRLDVDIATVTLGAVLWGGTSFIGATTQPPFCGGTNTPPCDSSQVNAFDRLAIGHSSQPARTAADIISFVPIAYLALDMIDVGARHWKTYTRRGAGSSGPRSWRSRRSSRSSASTPAITSRPTSSSPRWPAPASACSSRRCTAA